MSLLHSCSRAVPRQGLARALASSSRSLATDSKTPATTEKPTREVVPQPTKDIVTADVVSGAPAELRHRSVRIFRPASHTMQSGASKNQRWRIDWEILQGGGRWENPLMGWASSADYMQGTRMSFRTKEDAIHFAEKQGWDYYVETPEITRIPPKNYSENFLYKPNKLRIVRTK